MLGIEVSTSDEKHVSVEISWDFLTIAYLNSNEISHDTSKLVQFTDEDRLVGNMLVGFLHLTLPGQAHHSSQLMSAQTADCCSVILQPAPNTTAGNHPILFPFTSPSSLPSLNVLASCFCCTAVIPFAVIPKQLLHWWASWECAVWGLFPNCLIAARNPPSQGHWGPHSRAGN